MSSISKADLSSGVFTRAFDGPAKTLFSNGFGLGFRVSLRVMTDLRLLHYQNSYSLGRTALSISLYKKDHGVLGFVLGPLICGNAPSNNLLQGETQRK